MFSPVQVILYVCIYMGLLFAVALWVENKASRGMNLVNNPVVYSLSLAVFCTAWTYYGSVGNAANFGMLFLAVYIGPTLAIILWWIILRKFVRVRNNYHVTSIADFISARYNKSQTIAALVTLICTIGILPYIALQLKAIFSTFSIITDSHKTADALSIQSHEVLIVVLLILFTIIFGARRLDPTERHQGMIMAVAVESVVKLAAFLSAGIFVVYFMHNGLDDIFMRFSESSRQTVFSDGRTSLFMLWTTFLILSMSAIMFLPRQFHVSIVENFNEKHILTAMWMFPLYLLLINFFVYPIAVAGIIKGYPLHFADTFVLRLPLDYGSPLLTMVVFIGGFSAATSMVMICSMSMATMVTNHFLVPVISRIRQLGFLKRRLLACRWIVITAFIFTGYLFAVKIGKSYMLVSIGMLSFAAVLQFVPAALGGLFWRRGNKAGALMGLASGLIFWCYTLFLPSFVKSGWLPGSIIEKGPLGILFLRPEHFFGIEALDPLSHGVFISLLANSFMYVLGSLYFKQSERESALAENIVASRDESIVANVLARKESLINLSYKLNDVKNMLLQFFSELKSDDMILKCLKRSGIEGKSHISIVEFVEFINELEKTLSGSIGISAAYYAVSASNIISPEEKKELSQTYSEILSELRLTPKDLQRKIDYYQERESLLTQYSAELEETVQKRTAELLNANEQLQQEISERKRMEKELLNVQSQILQQDKMASIGQLAAGVAHEINNPMGFIISNLSTLHKYVERFTEYFKIEDSVCKELETFPDTQKFIGKVKESKKSLKIDFIADDSKQLVRESLDGADRVKRIVQDLKSFSRLDEAEWKTADINENIESTINIVWNELKYKATLKKELGDIPVTRCNPGQLNQVFLNLLVNAAHAIEKQGEISIKTFRTNGNINISVSDTGCGIPDEKISKVFEPFYTTKEVGKGTGLGLSIAFDIVKKHNGHISVESKVGEGTTFTITIPVKED